jgi:L-seryl-tRNA(Ser) seleniumtransferase
MNKSTSLAVSIILVAGLAGAQTAQDGAKPADVTGTWESMVESPQGTFTSTATYKQDGEQLTGTHVGQFGELELKEGTVKGSTITYKVTLDANGQRLTITYSGKVEGDRISGTADFGGMGSGAWTVKRKK